MTRMILKILANAQPKQVELQTTGMEENSNVLKIHALNLYPVKFNRELVLS
jgi:hypothetical protein